VPTTADDVFFDGSSSGTVTIATGNTGAKSINYTGFTGTLTGTAAISVGGSVTLASGMTYTHTGIVTFTGTGTLITAGKTFSSTTVNGSGITLTLGDAFTSGASNITVTTGTFDTANYNLTVNSLNSSNSNTRTITLGTSTLTLSSIVPLDFGATTNLTFNSNTSVINATQGSAVVFGGSLTYYNVSYTSASVGTRILTGANTFNNLTINASGTGLNALQVEGNQTVNGTLTCAGSSALARGFIRSNIIGTTRTITAAAVSANDCDFRDITIAGAASPISPTRAGNCGGNTNITFPAAKTVYRVGTNTTWTGSSSWALTSGGSGSNDNFPLAQDTIVINEDTTLTGTLALAIYNIGALDCSTRTTSITLNFNEAVTRYGSFILGSGVSVSGGSAQTFSGRGTMDFITAGKSITFSLTIDTPGGTFKLGDATTVSSANGISLLRGTLDANNYNLTTSFFASSSSNTRTITMGSGLWTLNGASIELWSITGSAPVLNKNTANILLSITSTSSKIFRGKGLSYNKLTIGGATGNSTLTFEDANSFTEIASTKPVAHTIKFAANQGTIGTWSVTGTSSNVVTVESSSAGTRRTFTLTNVTSGINYLSVKDIGETSGNKFYVGINSTDDGNNNNVYFTNAPGEATGNMLMLFI
jgi:hypothetical protein